MNKNLNKYFWGLLIAVIAGLTSCNTDVEGEYYSLRNADDKLVSFESKQYAAQLTKEESSVTVPVTLVRSNADNALTVNLVTAASHEGIFSLPGGNTISFAPGQQKVTFDVVANNVEKEVQYGFAISLEDKAIVDTLFLESSKSVSYKTFIPGVKNEEDPSKSTNDTIVIDTVKTDYYIPEAITTMQISVTREGDWTEWAPWNSEGTATYVYTGSYWEGEDSQPFYFRQNLITTNRMQFLVTNWGGGIDLLVEYDRATGYVSVPPQFTGYVHSSYGNLYISDLPSYFEDATEEDYGTFDEESGIFTIPVIYYVSAGYFGYDNEYIYIDGVPRADYSSALLYSGIFTNPDGEVFAVGQLTGGADLTTAKAVVIEGDADADAVADAIAGGDIEAVDVEPGTIYVPIPEGLTGKLQIVTAVIVDDEVKSVASAPFEYFGGGKNPWKSLGKGYLNDNLFISFFYEDSETKKVFDPQTYEVEILESEDEPGLYRIVNAFQQASTLLDYDDEYVPTNLEVNATVADGVYVLPQTVGIDDYGICTVGGYYVASQGFDAVYSRGFLGKVNDGVIRFPAFPYPSDGSEVQFTYQGFVLSGSKVYYTGDTGEFSIVLPNAKAEVKNKAKRMAKASDFARRLRGNAQINTAKKITKLQMGLTLKSGKKLH